jgi:hypothetical protein
VQGESKSSLSQGAQVGFAAEGFQRSWKMPLRRLDLREIIDLCDVLETKISEKVRSDIRSKMELMKNDMVIHIMRDIAGLSRNVGT